MGNWSRHILGLEQVPSTALIFAGTTPPSFRQEILNLFDKAEHCHDGAVQGYVVGIRGEQHLVLFQVYGSPLATDIIYALHDGGCERVLFMGYAYSDVFGMGTYFLPSKVICFDGFTNLRQRRLQYAYPERAIKIALIELFRKANIPLRVGTSISVSSLFHRISKVKERSKIKRIKALELELCSVYYFSRKLGMKCAGILIISDNPNEHLHEGRKIRSQAMCRLVKEVICSLL